MRRFLEVYFHLDLEDAENPDTPERLVGRSSDVESTRTPETEEESFRALLRDLEAEYEIGLDYWPVSPGEERQTDFVEIEEIDRSDLREAIHTMNEVFEKMERWYRGL